MLVSGRWACGVIITRLTYDNGYVRCLHLVFQSDVSPGATPDPQRQLQAPDIDKHETETRGSPPTWAAHCGTSPSGRHQLPRFVDVRRKARRVRRLLQPRRTKLECLIEVADVDVVAQDADEVVGTYLDQG